MRKISTWETEPVEEKNGEMPFLKCLISHIIN